MTNVICYLDQNSNQYYIKVNDEEWHLIGTSKPLAEVEGRKGQMSLFGEHYMTYGKGTPASQTLDARIAMDNKDEK
jgi:hypothetical protein